MKTKKELKTFLLLLLIALTLSSICNLEEAKKYCTSAGGVCIYKRQLHAGIHMKAD